MHAITEALFKFELMKHNPELVAKFEAERRKDSEECVRSSARSLGATVRRYGDGLIVSIPQSRPVNLSESGNGRVLQRAPCPVKTPMATPPPNDYPRLLVAEFRRKEMWHPLAKWNANHVELLRYMATNRKDQAALVVAQMVAEELGIEAPIVRAWRGDEKAAEHKWGWVCANKPAEINVTLDQDCPNVVTTTAHECRHAWQFKHYPNLTHEQRERDADEYARDFAERVFDKKAA
jgi:hypothetical protein